MAYAVVVEGLLDVLALSRAFEAVCRAHPVFTGCIRSGDAGHELVVGEGRGVPAVRVRAGDGDPAAGRGLDHAEELIGLEVSRAGDCSTVTLLTDHTIADATASVALLAELWGHYTDLVETGLPTPIGVFPIPQSLESLLARRGVTRLARNGVEALFEPVTRRPVWPEAVSPAVASPTAEPALPVHRRIRLTADATAALARLGRANGISVHGLTSAAVMIAHAKAAAGGPNDVVVPFMYPVDVRTRISPPVDALAGTNIFGTAGFKRSVGANTDPLLLAKALLAELDASITDGVVQQSQLHLTGQDQDRSAPAGTPVALSADTTMLTNWGRIPDLRTPAGLTIEDFRGAILSQRLRPPAGATPGEPPAPTSGATPGEPPAPTSTYIVTTFNGRLSAELATAHCAPRADDIVSALDETIHQMTT
ncbi:phthiocerol/phthiodiolone dimycocerosyl transferase family protein [Streptomyces sp. WM6378]|uniref:phthiocerol/phthiodiolone dimycocerosyl transferase family protein n=1 Tax=Streptomyces sp. WM6378 TaxID=1415557 RepID=UPI0006AEF1B0|nr:hypothetical protein [Streptomyces sp. WM6378]KOU36239.1 hypothetical protein ADK54_34500 [Streptomyces sp. WM6378]